MYANTPSTDFFLDKQKPSYAGGILEMANHRLYRFWGGLTAAPRTGQPQNELLQGNTEAFSTLYADPERLKQFLRAMTGISRGANIAIASRFPWTKYKTAADIGTAQGDLIGGFDYTGADCKSWMVKAGFRETRVEHLVGPDSMVSGIR